MPYLDITSLVFEVIHVARYLHEVYEVSKTFDAEIFDMMRQLQGIRPYLDQIWRDHDRGRFQDPPQLEALHHLYETVIGAEQLVNRMTGEVRGNVFTRASRIWYAKGNQQQVQAAATSIDRAMNVLTFAQVTNIGADVKQGFAHMVSRALEVYFQGAGSTSGPALPQGQGHAPSRGRAHLHLHPIHARPPLHARPAARTIRPSLVRLRGL